MLNPDAYFPVLKRGAGILDQYGIRFVLTGGVVAVDDSERRLTQDADLVVDAVPLMANLDAFVQTLIEGE